MSKRTVLFTDSLTNRQDAIPFDRNFAMRIGYLKYNGEQCAQHQTTTRHTISGNCVHCDAALLTEKFSKLVSPPTTPEAGLMAGQTWYYSITDGIMCLKCGGFSRRNCRSFRCVSCQEAQAQCKRATAIPKPPKPPAPPRAEKAPTAAQALMAGCPDMVIEREAARALGFKIFRTGKPCRRGHNTWRYVTTGGCLDCK